MTGDVDGREYLVGGGEVKTFMITAGETTHTFDVRTDDDRVHENNGSVRATVLPPASGGYEVGTPATVNVADNDVPVISILASEFVPEGEPIRFTVRSDIDIADDLPVRLEGREAPDGTVINIANDGASRPVTVAFGGGEGYTSPPYTDMVTVTAGSREATFTVDTTDHMGAKTGDGYFLAQVICVEGGGGCAGASGEHAPGYMGPSLYSFVENTEEQWLADDPSERFVRIRDRPHTGAEISICQANEAGDGCLASSDPQEEGTLLRFLVRVSDIQGFPVEVSVAFGEEGDFLSSTLGRTLTIPSNTQSITFEVATEDDLIDEDDGSISAAVIVPPEFNLGQSSYTISVTDNDTPALSISAPESDITEGMGDAVFTLTATIEPKSALTVLLDVSGDDRILSSAGERQVTLTFTGGRATHTVEIPDDAADEPDGVLTVTVLENPPQDYMVGTAIATVDIADDDPPQMSICQTTDGASCADPAVAVGEGGFAQFLITGTSAVDRNTDIIVTIDDPNGVLVENRASRTVTVTGGFTGETLSLEVRNDEVVGVGGGTVTATIDSVAEGMVKTRGYSVAPAPGNEAAIEVLDDDLPVIGLCAANENGSGCAASVPALTEGQPARYLLTVSPAVGEIVNFRVNVTENTENGDFVPPIGEGLFPVAIPSGAERSGVLTVATDNDVFDETDEGTFTVAIDRRSVDAGKYRLSARSLLAIWTVRDNDDSPEIGFTATEFSGNESDGAIAFTVRLSAVSDRDVTVQYETRDGSAIAGTDYAAASGTLIIPAGETVGLITVAVLPDSGGEEEDENFLVVLSSPSGAVSGPLEARGVILVSPLLGEANRVVLPRVAMAMAAQTALTIGDRVHSAFFGGTADGFTVRGNEWKRFIAQEAAANDRHAELPEVNLSDLAFALAADGYGAWEQTGGGGGGFSVWGRGYLRNIEAGGDVAFDGDITGAMVGVDNQFGENFLAGVGGNFFRADVDYGKASTSQSGVHDTTAWSVHPYFGWRPHPGLMLWGTGGYGMGEVEVSITGGNDIRKRDLTLMTIGGGLNLQLLRWYVGLGSASVEMVGDVAFARFTEDGADGIDTDVGTARGGLDFRISAPMGGGDIDLSAGAAYRRDFSDTVEGGGIEVGGGVRIGMPSAGLAVEGDARMLISHSDDVEERGFTGDISWSSGGGVGPYASFRPYWGATNDKRDALWERGISGISADTGRGWRYEAEIGYGAPLIYESGVAKVFARGDMENGEMTKRSGGVDVETVIGISAGYEAVDEITAPQVEHRGYIRFNRKF